MMTAAQIIRINNERLSNWGTQLSDNHCTPAILIGIGHDHRSGELHVCIPENMPMQMALCYLASVLRQLSASASPDKPPPTIGDLVECVTNLAVNRASAAAQQKPGDLS